MLTTCFVCNIERGEFDRGADGFQAHIKRDHNMWAYGMRAHARAALCVR